MIDLQVDWKESLLILLGFIIIILLYYVFNRKAIARDNEIEKMMKDRMQQPKPNEQVKTVSQKMTPQTIQAYERLIILMERIEIHKLVTRIEPISELKQDYATFLIQIIEQEYEFNISQQLYVTEEAWALIDTAKQTIIQQILKSSLNNEVKNADDLRKQLLQTQEKNSVSDLAKNRLKQEFKNLV